MVMDSVPESTPMNRERPAKMLLMLNTTDHTQRVMYHPDPTVMVTAIIMGATDTMGDTEAITDTSAGGLRSL